MMSTSDARVVDLPEPVGPVTSTKPASKVGEDLDRVGESEGIELGHLVRDRTERGGDRPTLQRDVDPESTDTGNGVRRVEFVFCFEALALRCRKDSEDHVADGLVVERRAALDGTDGPMQPDRPGHCRRQVKVGRTDGDCIPKQIVDMKRDAAVRCRSGNALFQECLDRWPSERGVDTARRRRVDKG